MTSICSSLVVRFRLGIWVLGSEGLKISKRIWKHVLKYRVIIEKDEDGVLVGKVPDLPGCATEGRTKEELMKNVKEAIQAYVEALEESRNSKKRTNSWLD
jgi:predicted RNase H-like HicB family nuclease